MSESPTSKSFHEFRVKLVKIDVIGTFWRALTGNLNRYSRHTLFSMTKYVHGKTNKIRRWLFVYMLPWLQDLTIPSSGVLCCSTHEQRKKIKSSINNEMSSILICVMVTLAFSLKRHSLWL